MLLCLVMIFSMMTVAVPVHAAPVASTTLTVAADKTTAAPGDEITYTITMGPVSDLGSIQMELDIPAGLTYVAGSRSLASGLKATLGFDDVAFTENMATGRHIINGVASAADYESAADTVIATFKCKVDAGATGTLEVGLTELEFISCQTFDDITSRFSVVKTAVAISGATPPPATYTVSFDANGGTGTMAEVTGVSAGAYTLPANGFTAPDGKRFVGWATSAGGTAIAAGGAITVSDNVTLYAIWEEIPTSHPAKPTLGITGTYTYSGSAQTVTVTGFDSATMLITGNVGTNAGTYTASVTSKSGRWADGTSTPITIEWSIGRKTVTPVIRVSGTYTYTGTPVEPTFTVEDGGVVISTSEYARTITDNDAVGTGKITVSDKTGGNYEILTASQTFEISAPTPPPTVYTSTEIKITADKTDAKAGDEITFTITMGPVSELGSIQMKLKLPAGLTVVAGSCRLAAGLKATLGFDDISFTEGTDFVITGVASAANYRSDADTVIATFKCKVDTSAPGNLKAELKELEFYSVDFTDNTSRFSVAPATITVADSRTKVSEVAGTSDLSTILVYGGAYKKPTVNVTTGAPAYFNINSANGKWLKKNSAGDWDYYTGATFTEGTYKFDCQVRIDGAAGLTHVLDSAGVTVTVDGVAWTTGTPDVDDDYSLVGVNSPEYTVTAPAGTPLAFAKNDTWNIGNTQSGMAITSFSVESGASGGTAPYTFSKVSGPAWLAVAPDGTVSGTPTAAGANEDLVIRVTDSAGTPASASITLTVGNTAVNPADRTKVNKVEGTSDTATIPVYGGAYNKPTVTVTTGAPAYFEISVSNGNWLKKNSAGVWERYTGATFTEGTYKFECQVRIDGAAGLTHVLDSAGVTVTVDGVAWTTATSVDVMDTYSYLYVGSPEYTVTAPAGTPLAFAKNDEWNIGNTQSGVAITPFSVAIGASGGTAPYTFSKVSGPAWLAVAPDGTVSGTPTAAGANEDLVIRVTDSAGTPASASITLTVGNTAVNPADRTKVNKVEGTSDTATIPVYGGAYKKPTVTVTTGAPAYFNINSANGKWLKKNSTGDWDYYTEPTFTEGTYKFDCQVRIDGAAGLTHMLDSAGVTVTVDGVAWTTGTPEVYDDFSLVGVSSPEYTVTSPSATTYTVTVTAGANMTTTGSTTQNVNVGDAMAEIICTSADGYYFPTDYTVAAVNGITVTRIDFTKIKVSGTPTAAANITLTAPTAKTKEATPTAVFTANGTDSGKLTGIAAGMKYRINGGAWMNITATEANLTGLSACTITIMKSGNGTTTIDSDEQTITVTKAAKPALTPTLLTLTGGKGSIPTTAAHEFSTDGAAWTPCTGTTENLDTGKYYVRVKANGTQLASETQEIDIFLYGDANGDGKVDIDDLTRLRRYNAEASTVIFPGADVNGDGTVDIGDLTRLRRYFAEEAVVLGK